jgi:hypothetical protein
MKTNGSKHRRKNPPTLAELIEMVNRITHDERLSSLVVADMINSRLVRLEGRFHGRRVHIG